MTRRSPRGVAEVFYTFFVACHDTKVSSGGEETTKLEVVGKCKRRRRGRHKSCEVHKGHMEVDEALDSPIIAEQTTTK